MPVFSANLNFLFADHPFLERFEAARRAGFLFVEYMFPYGHDPATLAHLLKGNGLRQVLFNLPAGDWEAGDRGLATDPGRVEEFRRGVEMGLDYAQALHVDRINCLVGKRIQGVPEEEQWGLLVENLRYAARRLGEKRLTLLVEPLNNFDVPGFFLCRSGDGLRLLREVGAENLMIQFDVYHMQRMEGNLTETLRANLQALGHVQIADVPGRHQPGTGEINYPFLLRELDRLGYPFYVGLEYIPEPDTLTSLAWLGQMGFGL